MLHKIILKGFDCLKSFWHFLKIVCVFCIIMLLLFWIQKLTHASWKWMEYFAPHLKTLLDVSDNICSLSFEFFGTIIELKYISAIIILLACYFGMNLVILLTNIIEAGYKSTHYICKKTQEIALNKELRDSIEREERSINKYVVTIHTKVKPNFSHKGINVDLEQQNGMMVDFIKNKLGVKPMIFEEGFMYNFDNYGRIDSVLEVLFKVMHGSTPIDYAICIQAGDNMPQLRKLISLKNFGKITMAADTSYRYRFNATHRYQTSQIGVFQNGDKTIEVHEFREFS